MIIDPASYIGGGVLYYTNYDICTLGEVVLFSEAVEKGQSNSYEKKRLNPSKIY